MTHTNEPHFLRCLTTSFLLGGIAMIFASTTHMILARDIGPGTVVVSAGIRDGKPVRTSVLLPSSAPAAPQDVEPRLVLGMVLILAGFGVHTFSLVAQRRG